MDKQGLLSFVLHAHLPYVRHPESTEIIEERWLFEAITECYVPLLKRFISLIEDHVPFRITMSFTPTLLAMLSDPLLQKRYQHHLAKLVELAEKEVHRTANDNAFAPLSLFYKENLKNTESFMERCNWNLIPIINAISATGSLELITSGATHAFLPLLATTEGIRAQLMTAIQEHERHFGVRPKGIWLPECAYAPHLDGLLDELGFDYFITDTHGVTSARPSPLHGTYEPVLTPLGVAAFGRDANASRQVWSQTEGYPGDYDYREYYRDIGFDLDIDWVRPYVGPNDIRLNTGFKYYRVTGQGQEKQPYRPEWAQGTAKRHAWHFVESREQALSGVRESMGRTPIVVAPYDAELFGHWWYEGPQFLEEVFRALAAHSETFAACTPSEYLSLYPDFPTGHIPFTSWGRDGYADVWLQPNTDWMYPTLHQMEERMISLANQARVYTPDEERALNQAAREVLLAQSSDWAFIMDHQTVVDYAVRRVKLHVNRFKCLCDMVDHHQINLQWLAEIETLDALFPELSYQVYQSKRDARFANNRKRLSVLMLCWEFPPITVGGLSRHVYDLSRFLARQGIEVDILTPEADGAPSEERVDGVWVHRVHIPRPDGNQFIHWAFQMNLAFLDRVEELVQLGLDWDVVHAHDWMVCYASDIIKKRYGLPLVATIHATEHGRNGGIHSDIQKYIHHLEWRLTYEAKRVIICSNYMLDEVTDIFQLPRDKIDLIPNGVDIDLLMMGVQDGAQNVTMRYESIVFFVGRLVREKGVATLIQAAPAIIQACPNAQFVIAGRGPMLEELQTLATSLGVAHAFRFPGFISDEERNDFLSRASVAVFPSYYEPFGIVALEAMATKTPVVVSDVGGLRDVVTHGHNGLRAYPGHPDSLAEQVSLLLTDRPLAERLASTASRELKRYGWSTIADQTSVSYSEALDGPAKVSSIK